MSTQARSSGGVGGLLMILLGSVIFLIDGCGAMRISDTVCVIAADCPKERGYVLRVAMVNRNGSGRRSVSWLSR